MSAKRNASGAVKPPRKRHEIKHNPSVQQIDEERTQRLQMFSLVPNDVLNIVRDYVCPPTIETTPTRQLCEALPVFAALGAPFNQILEKDSIPTALVERAKTDFHAVGRCWIQLGRLLPPSQAEKLCKKVRQLLGPAAAVREQRALARAALVPQKRSYEEKLCSADSRLLFELVAGRGNVPYLQSTEQGSDRRLIVAMQWYLWHEASILAHEPYNCTIKSSTIRGLYDSNTRKWRAPQNLVETLLSKHLDVCAKICFDLVCAEDERSVLWIVGNFASSINAKSLFEQYAWHRGELSEGSVGLLNYTLKHISVDIITRTDALYKCVRRGKAQEEPIKEHLLADLYDAEHLCYLLAECGLLARAEPFLPQATDNIEQHTLDRVVKHIMSGYTQNKLDRFIDDVATVERIPALRNRAGTLEMLDNALINGIQIDDSLYERTRQAGLRFLSPKTTLISFLQSGQKRMAVNILRDYEFSNELLVEVLIKTLQGRRILCSDRPTVEPILDTGKLNTQQVLVALLDVIRNGTCFSGDSRLIDQVKAWCQSK